MSKDDGVGEGGSPALELLASALAGRTVTLGTVDAGEPPWTNGAVVHLDPTSPRDRQLAQVAVQASLIAAGSLAPELVGTLAHRPAAARRYLALEGRRALRRNSDLLPQALHYLVPEASEVSCDSAEQALALARSKAQIPELPWEFGILRPKAILAARKAAPAQSDGAVGHIPRAPGKSELEELDDGEMDDSGHPDLFSSPVGGGGFLGKWLKKLLTSARSAGAAGSGPPGADSPTHHTRSGKRGAHAEMSTAPITDRDEVIDLKPGKFTYPEWDAATKRYRPNWCTVREEHPVVVPGAPGDIQDAISICRPLARLGLGLDRRRHQLQGDDIDIDAAVQERLESRAGSTPDEEVYIDSARCRRDLSVLLLLDISGSAAEPGSLGQTVHQQQRTIAAALTVALHDLGDRVSLYAYNSQGRGAVNLVPVKRFDESMNALVGMRLNSLEPGGYSRLGAAIRHGATVLEADGGTPRRLLVVLSDGLAYDHGYERDHGAADARRALTEARRRGTGCVCLTVGADTGSEALRAVFGSAAHAAVGHPSRLAAVIGPLFRSALRAAEVRRQISTPKHLNQISVPR